MRLTSKSAPVITKLVQASTSTVFDQICKCSENVVFGDAFSHGTNVQLPSSRRANMIANLLQRLNLLKALPTTQIC